MSECEMCSMKIFHLNYRSVGDPGPLMYFGNIREKLTINSNLENDKTWIWSTLCHVRSKLCFPEKRFSSQIQNWWKCTKEIQIRPKNCSRGRLLMNHEFCEIPTTHWLPEYSPPILECLGDWEQRWESDPDIWRRAVNKAAITRDNAQREEDLGQAVTRFMSLHVWEILALLLSLPHKILLSKLGRQINLILDNVLWQLY